MKTITKFIIFCAFTLSLSGCLTVAGQGNVKLSNNTAEFFEKFLTTQGTYAYYLGDDGKRGYYRYCIDKRCTPDNFGKVIYECQEALSVKKCNLFANRKTILWENAGNFMPYKSEIVKQTYGSYFYDE